MNPHEIDGRIVALQQQRDAAMNQVVVLTGKLAALEAELKELKGKKDATAND